MRRRKATTEPQCIRPVGEQLDVGKPAAERREVPWTVDVRQQLEQADHADRKQRRDREECDRSPQAAPAALDESRDPQGNGESQDGAYEPTPAGVEQPVDEP